MHTIKNPGEGVAYIFAIIPGVLSGRSLSFWKKFPGVPYFEFCWIFISKFLKIGLGVLWYTPLPPDPSTVCIKLTFSKSLIMAAVR